MKIEMCLIRNRGKKRGGENGNRREKGPRAEAEGDSPGEKPKEGKVFVSESE